MQWLLLIRQPLSECWASDLCSGFEKFWTTQKLVYVFWACITRHIITTLPNRNVARAADENCYVVMASLDLSMAFDMVNTSLLVRRLKNMGMPGDLISLIREWLTGRTFYVQSSFTSPKPSSYTSLPVKTGTRPVSFSSRWSFAGIKFRVFSWKIDPDVGESWTMKMLKILNGKLMSDCL